MSPNSPNSAVSQSTTSSWFSRGSTSSWSTSGKNTPHWKKFRRDVLAPHHIRMVETLSSEVIPEAITTWIEANRKNVDRFAKQRTAFRKQVAAGRGFGSSALFPQEVLPSNDARPFLTRCMVPSLSGDALPEQVVGKAGSAIQKSFLSVPRPGLGCGFSDTAFAPEETKCMPRYMSATGTTVHFGTGSIDSGATLYCPFLTYERMFSQNDFGLEIAANQCAINGAWSVRAMQMLYAKAAEDDLGTVDFFRRPISFTCAIDNHIAIISYHWVDHSQTYCMAPVVRFDLTKDDHFDQFLLWTEAIGQWALTHLLPEVKKAISLLNDFDPEPSSLINSLRQLEAHGSSETQALVSALKLTYDTIPWRLDSDAGSPVSSSTASWGSPMINEAIFAKFEYPLIPQPSIQTMHPLPALPDLPSSLVKSRPPASICSDSRLLTKNNRSDYKSLSVRTASTKQMKLKDEDYTQKPELVVTKRLEFALNEIRDLQGQLVSLKQELGGSTSCLQNELSGLRKTMTCVIRKEKMGVKPRSPIQTNVSHQVFVQNESRINVQKGISVVTTPTDPRARPVNWPSPRASPSPKVRTPSSLHNVLTLDTNVEAISTSQLYTTTSNTEPNMPDVAAHVSPITIYSPTIVNVSSPQDHWDIPEKWDDTSGMIRVPVQHHNLWSQVVATHLLSALVPATMLRVVLLGCLLDYCMITMVSSRPMTITQYCSHILGSSFF